MVNPFFRISISQQQSPKNVYPISLASHHFLPLPEASPGKT